MSIKKVLKSIPWIAVVLALFSMPVVDAASMEPCCRSDKSAQAMAEHIRDQISYGEFDPYLIKVQVRGEVVTLSGEVSSLTQANQMVAIAQSNKGIKTVENRLVVQPTISNEELRSRVVAMLRGLSGIQSDGIEVMVDSGVVGLSGSLPSFRAVDRVLANTLMVRGVREVRSNLKVAGKQYPVGQFKIH